MYVRNRLGDLEHPHGFGMVYQASTLGELGAFELGDIGALGITDECQNLSDEMERTYTQPWRDAGLPQSGPVFDRHKAGLQRVRECNMRSQGIPVTDIGPIGTEERGSSRTIAPVDTSLAPSPEPSADASGLSTGVKILLGVAAAGILGGIIFYVTKKTEPSSKLALVSRR
jgi:hypothetical protein